jgi:hypothetical protein
MECNFIKLSAKTFEIKVGVVVEQGLAGDNQGKEVN